MVKYLKPLKRRRARSLPAVRIVRIDGGLNFRESSVLQHLAVAQELFQQLDDVTTDDLREFTTFLHVLERQVMARVAQRGLAAVAAA